MIWGAHWCLMFYLFSANVRAGLSGKPQAENLVSEISVLKDTELGKSKARRERESFFSLVFTASEAKPKPPGAGASPRHSLPVGSGSEASKEGIQAVHAAATSEASSHPILWPFIHTLPGQWQKSKNWCLNFEYFCHESLQHFKDVRGTGVTFTAGKKNRGLQEWQLSTGLFLIS